MPSNSGQMRAAHCAARAIFVRGMAFATALMFASIALPERSQAQIAPEPFDISGSWAPVDTQTAQERGWGPVEGDLAGIPLSKAGYAREYAYTAALDSVPDHVCRLYSQFELAAGIAALRFWPVLGGPPGTDAGTRIIAWEEAGGGSHPLTTIWMNGMPQPSKYADHPEGGFTVGHWAGDVLIAETTNMKTTAMRRGVAYSSDQATMTSMFIPHDNGFLTAVFIMHDPAYLTRPYVYANAYLRSSTEPGGVGAHPSCLPNSEGLPAGSVPFFLPGSRGVGDMAKIYHVPDSAEGNPDALFPAFRDKMKDQFLKTFHTFPSAKNCTLMCDSPADILGSGRTEGFPSP